MSDYEQKDNSGVLFKNDKKESDRHPDYKGNIRVAGVDYWLSSWINTSKSGQKYMSVSVQPKDQAHQQGIDQAKAATAPVEDFKDDVPF